MSLETAVASLPLPSRYYDAEVTAEMSMDGNKERSPSLPLATLSRLWNSRCQPPPPPPHRRPVTMTMMMPPLPPSSPPLSWRSSASTTTMQWRPRSLSEEAQRRQRQRVPRRQVSPTLASCFPPPPWLPACNHQALQHSVRHL